MATMTIPLADGVERYVDRLPPETREIVEQALRTTLQYILGLRDGSCYRYETEIDGAVGAVIESHRKGRHVGQA